MTTRPFSDAEIDLIESALLARHRYRDRAFQALALGTGFRVGELVSVEWSQLLTSTGEVGRELTIERANLKGGAGQKKKAIRSRRVPLNERVRGAIADYLATFQTLPQGAVFKSRVGTGAITRGQAHRWLKRLARELGLDAARIGCHSARKSFALKIHREAKFDLLKTQRILGHSSPLVTAAYIENSKSELDAIVLGLDRPLAPAIPTLQQAAGMAPRLAPVAVIAGQSLLAF